MAIAVCGPFFGVKLPAISSKYLACNVWRSTRFAAWRWTSDRRSAPSETARLTSFAAIVAAAGFSASNRRPPMELFQRRISAQCVRACGARFRPLAPSVAWR